MRRTIVALLVGVAAAGLGAQASPVDDFYQARLQEGRIAFQTGRPVEAVDQLRVACFGLMDSPQLYSEAIVWLGLAQDRLNRAADVDATLRRFLEAEKRFGGYARIVLPAESRREFDGLLSRRLPPGVILSTPSLSRLVETGEQKIERLPPSDRARAFSAKAKAEPGNVAWPLGLARLALEQGEWKDAVRWAGQALGIEAENVEARRLRVRALTMRQDYASALADLGALPPGSIDAYPVLRADLFVCLAAAKRWDEARAASKGLPAEQLSRPDVAAALAKLPPAPKAVPPV